MVSFPFFLLEEWRIFSLTLFVRVCWSSLRQSPYKWKPPLPPPQWSVCLWQFIYHSVEFSTLTLSGRGFCSGRWGRPAAASLSPTCREELALGPHFPARSKKRIVFSLCSALCSLLGGSGDFQHALIVKYLKDNFEYTLTCNDMIHRFTFQSLFSFVHLVWYSPLSLPSPALTTSLSQLPGKGAKEVGY